VFSIAEGFGAEDRTAPIARLGRRHAGGGGHGIVFENKAAMDRFKKSEMNFGVDVFVVIAKVGVGVGAEFNDGEAVFVRPLAGGTHGEVPLTGGAS